MDQIALTMLSSATVAVVVGFVARWFFGRAVTKWMDTVDAKLAALEAADAQRAVEDSRRWETAEDRRRLHERTVDSSLAAVDKRLELGHLEFKLHREMQSTVTERVTELERRERERRP